MSANDLKPGDDDGTEPPTDEVLAGEYVLGVMNAGPRRAVQARIAVDPAFAHLVAQWEQRLESLHADIAPVEVPHHVWDRIRSRLGWAAPPARTGLWQSIALWRTATAIAVATAIVAILIGRAPPPAPRQPLARLQPTAGPVTTLARDSGAPGWLASIDVAAGTILLVPVPAPADARGRMPELWLIPQGKAPQSLGLLSNSRSHAVVVPTDLRAALTNGSLLAVTLEPAAGAPHRAPTGPIIAKGAIQL